MVYYKIEKGYDSQRIINDLYIKGVIKSRYFAKKYVKNHSLGSNIKAGIYKFNTDMTPVQIFDMIESGNITSDILSITIPEGYTVKQIADKLYKNQIIESKDEFVKEAQTGTFDYEFIKSIPSNRPSRLEGYLFPATYELKKGATSHDIIDKMLKKFNEVYNDDIASEMISGMTLDKIINMASIIEGEAKLDSERTKIAGVFYNRLKINMKLQSCATVEYILGTRKSVLSNKDTMIDSPYNTYKNAGLPIGPICSPGEKSIMAALKPSQNDYLYFVLDVKKGDGSHYFTNSYQDSLKFQKNNK